MSRDPRKAKVNSLKSAFELWVNIVLPLTWKLNLLHSGLGMHNKTIVEIWRQTMKGRNELNTINCSKIFEQPPVVLLHRLLNIKRGQRNEKLLLFYQFSFFISFYLKGLDKILGCFYFIVTVYNELNFSTTQLERRFGRSWVIYDP